jgi:hypothetical protein
MILRLTAANENGFCGVGRGFLEGRGFSPAVRALTHHFVVPPLPRAGEGRAERELPVTAGLKPRPSAAIFMAERNLALRGADRGRGIRARFLSRSWGIGMTDILKAGGSIL